MTHTRTDGKLQTVSPGPWEIDRPYQEDGLYIQAQDTSLVCKVYDDGEEYHQANARLIATAPALYEALKEAMFYVSFCNTTAFNQEKQEATYQRCKAALALVEGKE